jgi:hypothetical protein
LPGALSVRTPHDTTPFVMHRKDRLTLVSGQAELREHHLTPESPSRRVVAICCNTPLFLDFKGGHWLSIYTPRYPQAALPPLLLRTMAADQPADRPLPNDVPNPASHTFTFVWRLFSAWVAMGFRVPKVAMGLEALVLPPDVASAPNGV